MFQFFNLLPVLMAEENIVLPLTIAGRDPDREWLERLIEVVGLGDRRTHRPSELSGGQQQRVAVARALVSKPSVVGAGAAASAHQTAFKSEELRFGGEASVHGSRCKASASA